jgi:hypothetical protein
MIYTSARYFEVLTWRAGHGGLVLRSNPTDESLRRIEVWFKPAYALCLGSNLDGIEIAIANEAESLRVTKTLNRSLDTGETIYIIRSGTHLGWVVAGGVHGRDDELSYGDPPMFDGWQLKPGERQLFSMTN